MNINSYMPVKVVSGKNCFNENYGLLESFGRKCLIVTGKTSAKKSGALDDVLKALSSLSIEYDIFNEISENPYTLECFKAGEKAREISADFILGIGGGSPLDASKAVAIYAANPDFSHSDIYKRENCNKPLPVVLIGTTAGTGSEVTGVSVLTNSDDNMKKSISGPDCYAALSFCDYKYTLSLPFNITVSTALDSLSHALEAYLSKSANDLSSIYSEKAFSLLSAPLKNLYEKKELPSENEREILYIASLFAGFSINITGTCFPHALGYILTEDYNIPHGKASAAFLPDFIIRSKVYDKTKVSNALSLLEMSEEYLLELITVLSDVNVKIPLDAFPKYEGRWRGSVKGFIKSPGDFKTPDAIEILKKYS